MLVLVCLIGSGISAFSQEKEQDETSKLKQKSGSVKKSLERGEHDLSIAAGYEDLVKELVKNNDLVKAEEYQQKAVDLYKKNKSKEQLANALRSLAKIQEAQNKTSDAIQSYDKASQNSNFELNNSINTSDVVRLKNSNNPVEQTNSINKKLNILKKGSNSNSSVVKEDIKDAYKQLAEVNVQQNNSTAAIENYNNALDVVGNDPIEKNSIKNEIAEIYASNNDLTQAISIKNDILQNADSVKDINEQIKQRQGLAKLLILNKEDDKAVVLIREAYNMALNRGKTIEAKNSLIQLIDYYKVKHDDQKTLQLYEMFLQKLESLIKADTTLIDKKIFEVTDSKIKKLEQEKALKDELISKTNTFNYFLIASLVILILLMGVIFKYSLAVKTQNKKISLQSLRREMNPHFIFNSLNSVNQFIAQNKEMEANKYLTSYSSLMRNMMENSSKDFILLQKEIEQLKKYLELEHLRFNDKFDYKIEIDESIDTDSVSIPNMLLQPHLENAIWHGLRYKEMKGFLLLMIKNHPDYIEISIEDDGIGIEKSKQLKTDNQKVHQSIGIKNINERIALLNDLYKLKIVCLINTKPDHTGTIVVLRIPHLNKV
ncbi:MAG: regulator of cell autolysis [Bacteroidetes bacterium]|nr:regulator of cell autolysis [Bacteroidota bacterium]